MQITSRPFASDADLHNMLDLIIAGYGDPARLAAWHAGDLIWSFYQNTIFDPRQSVRLWEDATGELLAFGRFDKPDTVDWQLHPRVRGSDLLQETILAWAAEQARNAQAGAALLRAFALESESALHSFLGKHGFTRDDDHFVRFRRDLTAPIPAPSLPAGWQVRPVGGEDEWPERVETHREVWHPSKVTLEAYRRLRAAPIYRPELDLVAASPDGTFAAYCICWLDPVNKVGEFEPVGTRPAFRGRGLAKAVNLEGLRRLKALGAHTAVVLTNHSNAAAINLYQSVGFRIYDRDYRWTSDHISQIHPQDLHNPFTMLR